VHWDKADRTLLDFTAALVRLRREHPTFRRRRFFTGESVRDGVRLDDIVWLHPDGRPMADADWDAGGTALGMYLNGRGITGVDARGEPIVDDHFLLYFNVGDRLELTLPEVEYCGAWDVIVNTGGVVDEARSWAPGEALVLENRSTVVLREHREIEDPDADPSVAASLATGAEPPA